MIAARMLIQNSESDSTDLGGIVFGMAWWFIYAGVVFPCPLPWSSQCGFSWVKVLVTKARTYTLRCVGLGGLRFQ